MVDCGHNVTYGEMVDSDLAVHQHHTLAAFPTRSCQHHFKVPESRSITEVNIDRPIFGAWNKTAVPLSEQIPEKYRTWTGATVVLIVILAVTFGSPQTEQNSFANRGLSLFGLCVFYGLLYVTSADRKRIVWRTVFVGLLCQFVLALFVLRTKVGFDIFNFVSFLARSLLGFANSGTAFLTSASVPQTRLSPQIQKVTA
jgi:hypothetical protein